MMKNTMSIHKYWDHRPMQDYCWDDDGDYEGYHAVQAIRNYLRGKKPEGWDEENARLRKNEQTAWSKLSDTQKELEEARKECSTMFSDGAELNEEYQSLENAYKGLEDSLVQSDQRIAKLEADLERQQLIEAGLRKPWYRHAFEELLSRLPFRIEWR